MSLLTSAVYGLGRLLSLIGAVLRYLVVMVLALIVVAFGALVWMHWHPRVTVPLEGTTLAIVYQHEVGFDDAHEHLVLAEASGTGRRPLAEARSQIYKEKLAGGELWRNRDGSAFYLSLQSELYRIDVGKRLITPFQFLQDTCPSDATAPKWQMAMTDPRTLRPRPADLVFVGAIRHDIFTPAERLPPPPLPRQRNCAAEALAWDADAFTALQGTDLTIRLHLRWLPGDSTLLEMSVVAPKWTATSMKSDPAPRTASIPPRGRFSLYRQGDLVDLVGDDDTPMHRYVRLGIASGGFGERAPRPSCRAANAPPIEQPSAIVRPSRFFERLVWLGRFEARFDSLPNGKWGGDMVFVPADTATEEILSPERFCDPKGQNR